MNSVERDSNGVAHILGMSGGKDSTALALRMKELHPDTPMTYICTPTGDELPEMEAHWSKCEKLLGKPILRITNKGKNGEPVTLNSLIEDFKSLPSHRLRWCTRILKIQPTEACLVSEALKGPVILYVGLRADEEERQGLYWSGLTRFPMREWGWTVKDVWRYLEHEGVTIPRRTDCARCYGQRLIEWKILAEEHPDIYEEAIEQERIVSEEHGRPLSFRNPTRDNWPSQLEPLRAEFLSGRRVKGEEKYRAEKNLPLSDVSSCRVCRL